MDAAILSKLREWQREPAEHLLRVLQAHGSAVDCSDTGVGKTYVAVAVACALNLPTLVVVPKISVTAWNRVAEYFGDSFSVINYERLRTGNTRFGVWENQDSQKLGRQVFFVCQCCQQRVDVGSPGRCYAHPLGIHCIAEKKAPRRLGKFNFSPEVKAVIFDEIHRCNALDSLNAEMLLATKRQRIKTLGLSATLACDPTKMRAIGYSLDLHGDRAGKPNFYQWAARHGCRRIPPMPGIRWAIGAEQQKQSMAAIRSSIIPARGVRLTTAEIPGFPECSITAELYDIDDPETVERLYSEMAGALAVLETKVVADVDAEHPLTQVLRARQRIELLKVPIAVELATDALEKGLSVGIFVNFSQTIDELATRLGCNDIIDGRPANVRRRQQIIDAQQRDEIRLVLLNSDAGGISVTLSDMRGQFPRLGLVFPGFSATTFRQLCGRFPRDGAKSKSYYRVLLAAGVKSEAQIYRNLRGKLDNLSALNDADFAPDNLPLTKMVY